MNVQNIFMVPVVKYKWIVQFRRLSFHSHDVRAMENEIKFVHDLLGG